MRGNVPRGTFPLSNWIEGLDCRAVSVRFDNNETVIVNYCQFMHCPEISRMLQTCSCDCPEISHFVPKYFWTMHSQDTVVDRSDGVQDGMFHVEHSVFHIGIMSLNK